MSRQNYYRHRQRRQRRALQQEAVMAWTKEERQVQHGLEVSMTEENHCYENAHAERVNGILKREYALGQVLPSLEAAGRAVDQAVMLLQHAPAC